MVEREEPKRFFCGNKDLCIYKNVYVNNRCFAPYVTRQSCPNIIRVDKRTWRDGSKEEVILCK